MIECPQSCGRSFKTQAELDEHILRRHSYNKPPAMLPSLYENMKQRKLLRLKQLPSMPNNPNQLNSAQQAPHLEQAGTVSKQSQPSQVTKLRMIPQKTILRPSSSKDQRQQQQTKSTEKQVKIVLPEPQLSSTQILASKQLITRRLLLQNSGCGEINQVSHLVLNNQDLLVFESTGNVDFSELESLKTVSLYQNKLINVIGLSQLCNLIDLNIANNQIQSLQPLSSCRMLQKLYATNNSIQILEMGMMIHMKVFHIGTNHLNSFDSVLLQLKLMPSLKDLELSNNPCTLKYAYKYDVLWTCFIETLDHTPITQQDYNLAQAFRENKIDNKLNQSTLLRPTTAPNTDFEEIEQNQLEEEIEEMYEINSSLREKVDKLEEQNMELRKTAEKVEFLEEQLQKSRNTISAYESMLVIYYINQIFNDSPESDLKQQIFNLMLQVEELTHMNKRLRNEDCQNDTKIDPIFQATSTTNLQKSSFLNEQPEVQSDDDDKYLQKIQLNSRDDEEFGQQECQEMMELMMRNSMSLSQIKHELKQI